MKKFKILFSIISLSTVFFLLFSIPFQAKAIEVRSWIADLLNPTFTIELHDGDLLFDNSERRREINNDINSDGTIEYSLYDRFGPDISFFAYLGEIKIQTNIVDKVYSFIMDDSNGFSITETIDLFAENSHYVNNRVYEKRVDISNSVQDPRYVAWCNSTGLGGNTSVANMYLTIAKNVNDLFSAIISGELVISIIEGLEDIFDEDLINSFVDLFTPIYTILVIALIINIGRLTIKYVKGNNVGISQI